MIEIFTKDYCGYCRRAKELLEARNLDYDEIDITHDPELAEEVVERTGRKTVPQIFIEGQAVGGYDDLVALEISGELDRIILEATRAG
ncbi:MAG: glutaredoxin 3 [Vulcanimicrobiota bacterium]